MSTYSCQRNQRWQHGSISHSPPTASAITFLAAPFGGNYNKNERSNYFTCRMYQSWCGGENRNFSSGRRENATASDPKTPKFTSDSTTKHESKESNDPQKQPQCTPPPSSILSPGQQAIWKQMQNIPNTITAARIVATPLIGYWIITDQFEMALGGCLIAAFSDYLDGYIAKNYDAKTVLGSYLDPLADKFIITTLALSLSYNGILPVEIVMLWMTRDVILIGFCYWHVRRNTEKGNEITDPSKTPLQVEPTDISKVNTVLQFATLACGLTQPIFGMPSPDIINGICWVTAGTTCASGFSYIGLTRLTSSGNKHQKGN